MMQFAFRCFSSPFTRPTFLSSFPSSSLGKISEKGRFRCPCQIPHNSALWTLLEPQFAAKCCPLFALKVHTTLRDDAICARLFLKPLKSALFFEQFPLVPFGKISEIGRFRCPCQICHNSALRKLMEPLFPAKCCPIFPLQVHTN